MASVIASGHPQVTAAAAEVLRSGGNAFDAVVAGGFASAVAEPALTSLGGGGFLLARTSSSKTILFDFFVDTPGRGLRRERLEPHFLPVTVHFPSSDQIFNVGLGSVAVPGTLRGLLHVHRRLGRMPLAEVVAPAIELAREGVALNERQAYVLELLQPIMTLTSAGRALYRSGGRYPAAGERLANPELAAFLESLPVSGDQELYRGEMASRIARDMDEGGGLLTEADLAAYEVVERSPRKFQYRGLQVLTNPPPAFGGCLLGYSLGLLEGGDMDGQRFGSTSHLARLVAVMEEVDRRRGDGCHDPSGLSADELSESVSRVRTASGGTTHVSISDREGNVASMTTSNGEGSGYLVPGTGIMLNNMMGEDDLHPDGFHASPPGERVASMMSPTLLLEGERVRLVVGSGGSKRIRTALLQVVSNVVDFEMEIKDAVEAPRLHWDGSTVQAEPGFDEGALEAMARRWPVNRWPVQDVYFGGVHAVAPSGEGAGDPRRGGHATLVD